MTENEAISILSHMKNLITVRTYEEKALEMAIQALEEVLQYRAIGTVDECQSAVERMKPKKPIDILMVRDNDGYIGLIGKCPCCDDIVEEDTLYCDCEQKLDWEKKE